MSLLQHVNEVNTSSRLPSKFPVGELDISPWSISPWDGQLLPRSHQPRRTPTNRTALPAIPLSIGVSILCSVDGVVGGYLPSCGRAICFVMEACLQGEGGLEMS